MTAPERLRVGIVGGNPERGWARDAHVPALHHLSDTFAITAVSARTTQDAERAAEAFGAERAFGDSLALARDPKIDVVTVTVKVPEHRAVVLAALAAGKHVYCEWPLGRDRAEADEMAAAVWPETHAAIGLQGLSAPAVRSAAALVRDGAIGRLMAMRVFSPTAGWGAQAPPFYLYLQDRRNGATLETIAGGHTLAVMEALAGAFVEVDARASILRPEIRVSGTEELATRTCADHLCVLGLHAGGCVSTLEVAGGVADRPFRLELEGSDGWLQLGGDFPGGFQAGSVTLETSADVAALQPAALRGPPANVAESYRRLADDIRTGARTLPDFGRAVRLTGLLDTIDRASHRGRSKTGAVQ